MSLSNYIGIGGAIVVFGMTFVVLMKAFLAPWIVEVLDLHPRIGLPPAPSRPIKGVVVTFGRPAVKVMPPRP